MQGLIQSVFELHDGSGVVVTVGKYVTPNHIDINGNGLEPDYQNLPGLYLLDITEAILFFCSHSNNALQLGAMLQNICHSVV